jgi:hypothetical protein
MNEFLGLENVKGYSELTREQQEQLKRIYARHMLAMGKEARKDYTVDQIIQVAWDKRDKTVNIYFENIWWHYAADGTWY